MPTADSLPPNIADWTVEPSRTVLLVHDMQRYFLQFFPQDAEPVRQLIANTAALRERCKALGIPVAYTAQPGDMTVEQRGLLRDFWGPGMSVSPVHRRIVDELAPDDEDWVHTKWRYSAFHRSDLLDRLRAHGRDQLICCGIYAYTGVLMTAVDSYTHDIETFFVADAVADFTEQDHRLAVRYAVSRCAVVTTTADILAALDSSVPTAGGTR
ncbi:isochorismatase family protein [Nocardia sp. BMG51109]|uniref:isochorismatase family protein n=1 Tax=Nocardia sp. BMG51109 TaxID=1056816 RepID=UPI0004BC241D|nr:isochorismatase family protein [Nocardia sp. BMG51109]